MDRRTDLDRLLAGLAARAAVPSSDYDLNTDIDLPAGRRLRPAAVLIGVAQGQVILTKRAPHLKHHPGQIAFPGGKLDPGDPDPPAAALREAQEEVGLPPDRAEILHILPPHETVTGYTVYPVIARIDTPFEPVPEPGEVAEVFHVPLSFLLHPAHYRVERRRWRGRWRHFYTVPYGPYYIWGATARILRSLADRSAP
jgi:8-oxo-dGTP pyrophosphatase MutT (NUDIX family)